MLINFASEDLETFKGSEMSKKREMLNFVFQNLKLKGHKLEFTLRFPFDIFKKTTTRTEWLSLVNDFITKVSMKILIIQTPIHQLY